MTIFFKLKEVLAYRHRSRSSHFRDIKNGLCTKPINVGPNSVVWLRNELETLRAAVIAGKSEDEINLDKIEADMDEQANKVSVDKSDHTDNSSTIDTYNENLEDDEFGEFM